MKTLITGTLITLSSAKDYPYTHPIHQFTAIPINSPTATPGWS